MSGYRPSIHLQKRKFFQRARDLHFDLSHTILVAFENCLDLFAIVDSHVSYEPFYNTYVLKTYIKSLVVAHNNQFEKPPGNQHSADGMLPTNASNKMTLLHTLIDFNVFVSLSSVTYVIQHLMSSSIVYVKNDWKLNRLLCIIIPYFNIRCSLLVSPHENEHKIFNCKSFSLIL